MADWSGVVAGGGRRALSDAEERVARLAALGRTNREIADELDLSAKTVEWTLTRIYRKAGVRSRTELAVQFAADSGAGGSSEHFRDRSTNPPKEQ